MNIRDFVQEDNSGVHESEWLDFAEVSIPSGEMVIADPTLYPDGIVVHVHPGRYHVQVMIRSQSGSRIISRLRAYSSEPHLVAASLGSVSIDFARLGIGDNVQISDVTSAMSPEMAEPIWQSLETNELFGIVPWNVEAGVEMPFVTPGDGDGRYEVHELRKGQSRVGVQVEFLQGQQQEG